MPEDIRASEELIDVGETVGADINLDEKGEPVKQEEIVEEKIEVEQVPEDKTFENEREVKVKPEEKKDELEEYSKGVQSRIAKLTRKMREAERQREEAVTYAQSVTQQKNQAEKRLSKLDKSYVSEFESRVTTSLAAAKLALKNAIESQDVEAQISAQEQLATLSVENARLNALKVAEEDVAPRQREVNINPQRQQQQPQQQSDPRAEDWASKNSWFGNDSAMTYTAFDIHKKLVEEEGFDPKSNEYYEEVDSRIRLEFPHKFDKIEENTTRRARPAQAVASATRSGTTGRKKTVKLSPSQVAIAKRLGVPLEDYAKQLNITEGQ
jgi:hypothetical protein